MSSAQVPHSPFDVSPGPHSGQLSLEDLGTPLHEVTFVVVDLETTGTHGSTSDITEIGAVKTRGGERLGEFQTLVRPDRSAISPFVEQLTGITNAMVRDAPAIDAVLPMFLEFAHGAVLVAHNAGFDIGFLRAACERLGYAWPDPPVLDTVRLARQVVPRPEVPNHKLGTLARFFGTAVEPDHRALADARATSEILHLLFERFGGFGITTLEDLSRVRPQGWQKRRAKAALAEGVPAVPGVYMFLDGARRVLYVGVSGNMRTRVRNYFTAGETRGRMAEMVTAAQEVTTIECDTVLEARIREVRLIAELAPPYNRRSKHPERRTWIRLTEEPFGRLSVVRTPPASGSRFFGPFRSHRAATEAKHLLETVFPVKSCAQKIGGTSFAPCAAGEIGRCAGPCAGLTDPAEYEAGLAGLFALMDDDPSGFVARCRERMGSMTLDARFEEAARVRDAMLAVLTTGARVERNRRFASAPELLLCEAQPNGGRNLAIVRYGRLVGAARCVRGQNIGTAFAELSGLAEAVDGPADAAARTHDEEIDIVRAWACSGSVRLYSGTGAEDALAENARGCAQALTAFAAVSA